MSKNSQRKSWQWSCVCMATRFITMAEAPTLTHPSPYMYCQLACLWVNVFQWTSSSSCYWFCLCAGGATWSSINGQSGDPLWPGWWDNPAIPQREIPLWPDLRMWTNQFQTLTPNLLVCLPSKHFTIQVVVLLSATLPHWKQYQYSTPWVIVPV